MKFKYKKASSSKSGELVVISEKNDELKYEESKKLIHCLDDVLLPLRINKDKDKYRFTYILEQDQPLYDFLGGSVSDDLFRCILNSFLRLAKTCETNDLALHRTCFYTDYIYLNPQKTSLHFAYIPLTTNKSASDGPIDALGQIMEWASGGLSAQSRVIYTKVIDFVRASNGIFNRFIYEEMLQNAGIIASNNTISQFPQVDTLRLDNRDEHGWDDWKNQPASPNINTQPSAGGLTKGQGQLFVGLEDESLIWELKKKENILGRSPNCDICITNSTDISREHAKILLDNDMAFVEDLDSLNGTFVNDDRVYPGERRMLSPRDKLKISNLTLKLFVK